MKKTINFIAVASVLAMTACGGGKKAADSYTISGQIEGLPDSTVLLIKPLAHSDQPAIAEAMVMDGKFEFSGIAEEPMAVVMTVKDNYGAKTMMLENAEIVLNGKVEVTKTEGRPDYFNFEGVEISGSPLLLEYNEMMAPRRYVDSVMSAAQNAVRPLMEQQYAARTEGNKTLVDSIANLPQMKEYAAIEKWAFNAFDSVLNVTVEKYKDSMFGPIAILSQYAYVTSEQRPLFEMFSDSIQQTAAGKILYKELYPVGKPGDKVPAFSAKTIDGQDTSLEALLQGKKYVLLDFWASWCRPCRAEIPNIKKIYDKHNANGFDIVSISIDDDDAAWRKAVEQEQLKWTNLRDADDAIAQTYSVSAVPTMYLIDADGNLVLENLRGEELAAKIDELMAK